jgi:hypothetical protein
LSEIEEKYCRFTKKNIAVDENNIFGNEQNIFGNDKNTVGNDKKNILGYEQNYYRKRKKILSVTKKMSAKKKNSGNVFLFPFWTFFDIEPLSRENVYMSVHIRN